MVKGFGHQVRALLSAHGFAFVRQGKGSHEVWQDEAATRTVIVPRTIMSRHTANEVLKQAGIGKRL